MKQFLVLLTILCNAYLCVYLAAAENEGNTPAVYHTKDQTLTLDQYLEMHGFFLSPTHSWNNEGYMSNEQKEQFKDQLAQHAGIKSILEIGLNGGHSADNFLQCCQNLEKFVSFDINMHAYTAVAVDYLSQTYSEIFEFVEGDSNVTIPQYASDYLERKFDLIYIDGGHSYQTCLNDIINCKLLAHAATIVWIDDYGWDIQSAVTYLQNRKFLELVAVHKSSGVNGERVWAEVHYNPAFIGINVAEREAEDTFTAIYDTCLWGRNAEGLGTSGAGSILEQTRPYMEFVQNFMKENNIRSVVDAGCGDWSFASQMNWEGIDYLGYDIVKSVIERDQERYSSANINFIHANAVTTELPPADLLLCKDVLQHCTNEEIATFLLQCPKFRYCLITNDIDGNTISSNNPQIPRGECRPLDLTQPPFNVIGNKVFVYYSGYIAKLVLLLQNEQ